MLIFVRFNRQPIATADEQKHLPLVVETLVSPKVPLSSVTRQVMPVQIYMLNGATREHPLLANRG